MRLSPFARKQRVTIISGIAAFQMIIVLLQLWLFTTTMETFLAGYQETALPAVLASAVCFALNVGLFSYLRSLER
jgi:flagellar biosynthesis/type III secretory pathway M-ring protein FliF/YscJ